MASLQCLAYLRVSLRFAPGPVAESVAFIMFRNWAGVLAAWRSMRAGYRSQFSSASNSSQVGVRVKSVVPSPF
jgi:hypothetical protein